MPVGLNEATLQTGSEFKICIIPEGKSIDTIRKFYDL
jgi:hypothetical protein